MAGYAIGSGAENGGAGGENLGTSYKTILSMYATTGALTRANCYEFSVAADTQPANNTVVWNVQRMTVDGTGEDAITPVALNPIYGTALFTSGANYTGEPTVTANTGLWSMALNQQASFRWHAGRDGLWWPATAANGLVIRAKGLTGGYASTVLANALVEE